MMIGKGFKKTMIISISLSVTATVAGIILSYPLNWAPSGTIVMILVATYVGTLLIKRLGSFSKKITPQENIINSH